MCEGVRVRAGRQHDQSEQGMRVQPRKEGCRGVPRRSQKGCWARQLPMEIVDLHYA